MASQNELRLRRSRRVGELVNFTLQFFRENARTLARSTLYIAGPVMLFVGLGLGGTFYSLARPFQTDGGGFGNTTGMFVLLILASVVVQVLMQGIAVLYVRIYIERDSEPITVGDVMAMLRANAGRLSGTALAVLAIYAALFAIGALVLSGDVPLAIKPFLLLVLCGAGVYLFIPLLLAIPVSLLEDSGPMTAIPRCFGLIRGYWWSTLWVSVLLSLIGGIVGWTVVWPVQTMTGVLRLFQANRTGSVLEIVYITLACLSTMFSLLCYIITALGGTLQYFNIVEQRDHVGLLGRIDTMGGGEEPRPLNPNSL